MRKRTHWFMWTTTLCSLLLLSPFLIPAGDLNLIRTYLPEIISVASAEEEAEEGSISRFRAEALHRAARISWKVNSGSNGPMTFEIYRAMANPDGEYTLVTSIAWDEGMRKYKYVDKDLPVEENYFYRVQIPETNESFGPVQVRPPFSLPTT